ncbi:ROK family protein [Hoyosella rhizosphaerae]|uniref:Glucokinase n=1 Tax=Hoyosella rhizosphaerae TaxID=1755582 RepID=A0A916XHN2_9ACTN|nr:ROK family protein [Hoyosella rhizosphaerae]MBN4927939.1 ROK family protein [Hoyosella rhizosphaerae]GGC71142.1 glucokinase [Hoyosella rhizosphaerae]
MDTPARRSRRDVSPSPELAIGVDIGGTNIRAGVVAADGTVIDTVHAPTPHSVASLELALEGAIKQLIADHAVSAVGLAVAGFLSKDKTTVQFAPHLPWRQARVGVELSQRLGVPVVLEHDANAAGWAEFRFGAAMGGENVVTLAIGTGIGAALVIDGEIYRGSFGVAPELGHLQVVPNGRSCPCGKRGCWERYCSGTGLIDSAIELLAANPRMSTPLARELRQDPESVSGRRVMVAAQEGDPLGEATIAYFARWLGVGLALVSDVYDPDLIVLGGGVGSAAPLFLDEAREHYIAMLTGAGYRPLARIRRAQMGEDAATIGAADIARTTLAAERSH